MRTAILTDSNSGITQARAKELGITVIPMPVYINEKLYYEDLTLSQEEFYKFLESGASVHTSQPSPGEVMDVWNKLLEEYDEIVHIPMSSGLSSTCENAIMLSRDEDYAGRVFVVDNQRISVTMMRSVLDAIEMAKRGVPGVTIARVLEETALDSSIYIAVDTMEYLKKGGRVTAAAAGIATVLNIKPVLQIQGGKLDSYAKVRGMKSAKREMINAMKEDMEGRFKKFDEDGKMVIAGAYTASTPEHQAMKNAFIEEIKAAFPNLKTEVVLDPLSLSVSCHIGPGALAIAAARIVDENDI